MEKTSDEIYDRLPAALLPWYGETARPLPWRRDREPYHVWLSEIMLQQTRAEVVAGYFLRFLEALPTVFDLAAVSDEALLKLWEGLGYYSRARNLKKTAEIIVRDCGGRFPETYDELLALPGVGPYTAGAVASICFDRPVAAVDGNVLRVITRVTGDDGCIDDPAVKKRIGKALTAVYPKGACGDFTQGLMELGATVCPPNTAPKCELCPLGDFCRSRADGWRGCPVRKEKRDRRVEKRTVFVLRAGRGWPFKKGRHGDCLRGFGSCPMSWAIWTTAPRWSRRRLGALSLSHWRNPYVRITFLRMSGGKWSVTILHAVGYPQNLNGPAKPPWSRTWLCQRRLESFYRQHCAKKQGCLSEKLIKQPCISFVVEAPPRFELGIKVLQTSALPLGYGAVNGAGDGTRTRDFHLGKVTLYH